MVASSTWVIRRVRVWPGSVRSSSLAATRPWRLRKARPLTWRVVRRTIAPRMRSRDSATWSSLRSSRSSSGRVTTSWVERSTASAEADRGPPSSRANSPKMAGALWRCSSISSPSRETVTSFTEPSRSTNIASPGSSCQTTI